MTRSKTSDNYMKTVVMHLRTQLKELAPALNAIHSESVQQSLVDRYIIPQLFAAERESAVEASIDYLIGLCSQLLSRDAKANKELLSHFLRVLVAFEADRKAKIMLKNTDHDDC